MKVFYCPGTHWDREWYEPFQEFRMWLVELIDEVMELLERDPDYACFHLDGQTITVEDYLAVRPEQRERLFAHIRAGRIHVGPWYNLPDEWLISGESYVRNLMRGLRLCREWGLPPTRFAYTPDQFGHIAALPTIMAGFGLEAGIVWRGTQNEDFPAQFLWEGPDGSRLMYHKLADEGSYAPFLFLVREPAQKEGGTDAAFLEHFGRWIARERTRGAVPAVLALDAIDHYGPAHEMGRRFRLLREAHPDLEFVWGSIAAYGAEMVKYRNACPVRRGELVQPRRAHDRGGQYLIVHTISSRYPLKRANDRCQTLLEKWAEPYALFLRMAGGAPIVSYLDRAWEYLLKNHPHDSICGCSIDQVHRDMVYRFDQARLIGDGFVRRALASLAGGASSHEDWTHYAVHNPLPYPREGVVELALAFPADYGAKTGHEYRDALWHAETYNKFHIETQDGARIPYQLRRIERGVEHRPLGANGRGLPPGPLYELYHVAAEMALPPCGAAGLRIVPTDDATRTFGTLRTGPLAAHNGHLRVEVEPDGRAALHHDASGVAFHGLFLYADDGDSGDGWTRGIPTSDCVYIGPGAEVTTAIEEDGPLRVVFRIDRVLRVPSHIDRKTWRRSEDRVELRITDRLILDRGAPFLRVRTTVHNNACDHRLRVLFPGYDTAHSFADTPFAVVERPIDVPAETALWQERVNIEKPFTSFCGMQDGERGLAVLAPAGLHEYAVTPDRCLALTLFRSYWKTVFQPEEPGGQLQGPLEFEYLLSPFLPPFDPAEAARIVAFEQAGIRAHNVRPGDPLPASWCRLEAPGLILSTLKAAEDGKGGVLRLWNPHRESKGGAARFALPLRRVQRCNLDEAPHGEVPLDDPHTLPIEAGPGAIVSYRFDW